VNALEAMLNQPPTVSEMLSCERRTAATPVACPDELEPMLAAAYREGAKFARLPAGHDDLRSWVQSLDAYAARYASEIVQNLQEGSIHYEETN
jgi:hypothetical protein